LDAALLGCRLLASDITTLSEKGQICGELEIACALACGVGRGHIKTRQEQFKTAAMVVDSITSSAMTSSK
jgi:hypothetical protein